MSTTIWDQIASTPWWVFFIDLFLLRVAYLGLAPRPTPVKNIRNFALIFPVLAIALLALTKQLHLIQVGYGLTCAIIGAITGWALYSLLRIKYTKMPGVVQLPGNWVFGALVILLIYMQINYGYQILFELNNKNLLAWVPEIYGGLTGLAIGKYVYLRQLARREVSGA